MGAVLDDAASTDDEPAAAPIWRPSGGSTTSPTATSTAAWSAPWPRSPTASSAAIAPTTTASRRPSRWRCTTTTTAASRSSPRSRRRDGRASPPPSCARRSRTPAKGCTTTTLQATDVGERLYDEPRLPPAVRHAALGAETLTEPQPRARRRHFCPRCGAAAQHRLPALDPLPELRLRRLLQPQAGRVRDRRRRPRPHRSSCAAPPSRARAAGRCRAASWTSASPSRRRRHARPEKRSGSTSSSAELVGVYSRSTDRIVVVVYKARALGTPVPTEEALEVRAFDPTDIPWDELAFWSDDRALRDCLAMRSSSSPSSSPPSPAATRR